MNFIRFTNTNRNILLSLIRQQSQANQQPPQIINNYNIIQPEKSINHIKNINQNDIGLIIPFYQYPYNYNTNDFKNDVYRLVDIKKKYDIPMIVIVNPNNGAGSEVDEKYKEFIEILNTNGIYVAGYVYTNYHNRNIEDIKSDINKWKTFYPTVKALFIDELKDCDNSNNTQILEAISYINSIINYANTLDFEYYIGNFGIPVCKEYLVNTKLNNYLIIENYYDSFINNQDIINQLKISVKGFSKYMFSIILHSYTKTNNLQPLYDNTDFVDFIYTKLKNFAGYIYITDNIDYNTLPQYFEEFITTLENIKNKEYVEYLIQKRLSIYSNEILGIINSQIVNYDSNIFDFNTTTRFLTLKQKSIKNIHLDDNVVDNNTIEFNTQRKLRIKEKSITKNHLANNIDASDIGFNADKVDGYDVDNSDNNNDVIWTSNKIKKEIIVKAILFG